MRNLVIPYREALSKKQTQTPAPSLAVMVSDEEGTDDANIKML